MSGSPTFDIDKWKKNRNGANLQLRHALRAGGVKNTDFWAAYGNHFAFIHWAEGEVNIGL